MSGEEQPAGHQNGHVQGLIHQESRQPFPGETCFAQINHQVGPQDKEGDAEISPHSQEQISDGSVNERMKIKIGGTSSEFVLAVDPARGLQKKIRDQMGGKQADEDQNAHGVCVFISCS